MSKIFNNNNLYTKFRLLNNKRLQLLLNLMAT